MDCERSYPIDEVVFSCQCGGLLDVRHDLSLIRQTPAAEWKEHFAGRMGDFSLKESSSGVWAFKEWVLPGLPPRSIVSLGEGRTPLLPVRGYNEQEGLELLIKQCGVSHSGSFKDLGMTVLVSHVHALRKAGKDIRMIACASTGDTSAALAVYAASAGIPSCVFLPAGKISPAQLVQPLAAGSLVLSLDTDFDGCMQIVQEITKDSGLYLANSMNPFRLEGQKTIAFEIALQLDWELPDWIIIPGGNLGNVSALGEGLLMLRAAGLVERLPRICVAQASAADPLYRSFQTGYAGFEPFPAKKTHASAIQIGNPVSYKRAIRALRALEGFVETVLEEELTHAASFFDQYGFFHDPHTGVALGAFLKLKASGKIVRGDRVVVISTAHGLKFSEFKTASVLGKIEGGLANLPVDLPADANAVRKVILERL
ncbi:MAG: threonine synthase [Spirochaetales bacterium]|nr:threonine synthase [Spirochaetales bacterium]